MQSELCPHCRGKLYNNIDPSSGVIDVTCLTCSRIIRTHCEGDKSDHTWNTAATPKPDTFVYPRFRKD